MGIVGSHGDMNTPDSVNIMVKVNVYTAEKLTKQVAFKKMGPDKRKLVLSTNWLPLVDFEAGAPTMERSLGDNKGIEVVRVYDLLDAPLKTKKVYSRQYKRRKNNPLETLLDIGKQSLLSRSFPNECTHVHVTFTKGRILITPLFAKQHVAIENAKKTKDYLSVFAALTSGVDLYSLEKNGFNTRSIIEWRPQEARDKKDFTETGALNVLANIKGMRNVYNENINTVNVNHIVKDVENNPFMLFTASPQCDDYSNVKAKSLKDSSLVDLSSSIDMTYDLLRIVDALAPPMALFENVGGWLKSDGYTMLSLRMRRWGYSEHVLYADARDYGGLTARKRAYAFFSALPVSFDWESVVPRNSTGLWDLMGSMLDDCRDVTHSKSLQDGLVCGRLRVITKDSVFSPTILKSQLRQAKDSVVIQDGDRLLWPTERMMRFLMGVDEGFNLNAVSSTIASEIIGQSVDIPLHDSVVRSVKNHIERFVNSLGLAKDSTLCTGDNSFA